jgi:transposase
MVGDGEQRVPREHPLRRIKQLTDAVFKELSPIFECMYSAIGRPSIPPERLLKASLLPLRSKIKIGESAHQQTHSSQLNCLEALTTP